MNFCADCQVSFWPKTYLDMSSLISIILLCSRCLDSSLWCFPISYRLLSTSLILLPCWPNLRLWEQNGVSLYSLWDLVGFAVCWNATSGVSICVCFSILLEVMIQLVYVECFCKDSFYTSIIILVWNSFCCQLPKGQPKEKLEDKYGDWSNREVRNLGLKPKTWG